MKESYSRQGARNSLSRARRRNTCSCRSTKLPIPRPQAQHLLAAGAAPPARALSLSPTAPFLPTAEEMGERTPAETAFLHFLSALYRLSMQSCAPTQSAFSYPLSVKRTVPAFTGAEASATACFSHGRRFSLLPLHPQAFPLEGSAVLNDTPVACQTRRPTDPQGDRCPHIPAALAATYPLRCSAPQWARFDNRQRLQRTRSYPRTASAAAAQAVQAIPEPTMLPTALHARVHTAKSA